jgi:CPA2 family monovalent cation:H+ antiporter-2
LLVILASAAIAALIMQRMRFALIPMYLITGVIIGPNSLGLVREPDSLEGIQHLAIILLLFGIGLDLHLSALRHGLVRILATGILSCLLTVALGYPAARAFGMPGPAALVVAMALSLSSTAMVLRLLASRRELRRVQGRLSLGILVVQDLMVLGMLGVLPLVAAVHQDQSSIVEGSHQPWWVTAMRIAGVLLLTILGRVALPRLMRESLHGRSLEIMMIVGVAAALASAQIAHSLGFSLEMGAFLAGFALSGTRFRHQLSAQIGPLRDLFIAVFFTSLGMKLDPMIAMQNWWLVIIGTVALILLKAVTIGATCWLFGATLAAAAAVGLSLAQAGEFSLVLLNSADDLNILSSDTSAITISVVVISLIMTPLLVQLAGRLGESLKPVTAPWWPRSLLQPKTVARPRAETRRYVILAGYGPVARHVGERLDELKIDYTIIELNPQTVRDQARLGRNIVFGDVSNPEVWESAEVDRADAVVLTVPDEDAVLKACATIRNRKSEVYIAARTATASRQDAVTRSGANEVIADELASAEAMLRSLTTRLQDAAGPPAELPREPSP